MNKPSRRSLLRGAGVALSLPFLESVLPRRALAQASPTKRLLVFHVMDGIVSDKWWPSGEGSNFTLAPIMTPCEPHKNDLVILRGVNNGGGKVNHRLHCILTGVPETSTLPRTSIDQVIGPQVKGSSAFPTLEFGVKAKGYGQRVDRMIYSNDQLIPSENDPRRMFERMFGSPAGADPGAIDKLRVQRKSVLDAVKAEWDATLREVGGDDRVRLDMYATALREVEKRLAAPSAAGAPLACGKSAAMLETAASRFDKIARNQIDLAVLALACGTTKVATIQFGISIGVEKYEWLLGGSGYAHHDLAHNHFGDSAKHAALTSVLTWYMQEFSYLIGRMKQFNEGPTGTLFSNSLVVWQSNFGVGSHDHRNLPYVLTGGAAGQMRGGRYLKFTNEVHKKVLISMAHFMGVRPTSFGDPQFGMDPLPGLLA